MQRQENMDFNRIQKAFETLEGIAEVLEEHRTLFLEQQVIPMGIVIGGRFKLDGGKLCVLEYPKREAIMPLLPPVVDDREFFGLVQALNPSIEPAQIDEMFIKRANIPTTLHIDPISHTGWTPENIEDVVVYEPDGPFGLDLYVGKTYAQMRELLKERTDGVFTLQGKGNLLFGTHLASLPGAEVTEDGLGILLVGDDYVIKQNEMTLCSARYFMHQASYEEFMKNLQKEEAKSAKERLSEMLLTSGFSDIAFEQTAPTRIYDAFAQKYLRGNRARAEAKIGNLTTHWQISTAQSPFSATLVRKVLGVVDLMFIDLKGTGVTCTELGQDSNSQDLAAHLGDNELLELIWNTPGGDEDTRDLLAKFAVALASK